MAEKFLFINSNKKDSLCEHVIFERTITQSPGFSGNHNFFNLSCHCQICQNYEESRQKLDTKNLEWYLTRNICRFNDFLISYSWLQ